MTERTTRYQPPETAGERILGFIRQHIADHGYSPSHREIVDAAQISSVSVVHYWMLKLRDDGLITWVENQARTVRCVGNVTPSDLVLKLTAEQHQLIEEACGGQDVTNCAKATLILMATQHRMAYPTNGQASPQGATRRGGPRA